MSPTSTATATIRRLSYWYPGTDRPALEGLDLDLSPGLTLVAGASGGGKSTLLRLLNGLVPQFHGGRIAGSAVVAGLDPLRDPVSRLAQHAGLVFQDVETQSVYGTVDREIAFGLENVGLSRPKMRERVDAALAAMSIEHLRSRRLATLSGGERQRVQLAAVLALEPELIALDEPTSQLDRTGAESLLRACRSLADTGRTVVLAEHRLEYALPAADSLLLVEAGRVDGPGDPAELAERLASPPALIELARRLGLRPIPLSIEGARVEGLASAWSIPMERRSAVSKERPTARPAFEVRDLAVGAAREPIASGIAFSATEGEVVAVLGANGSGKTTFLRTIAGLLAPISGSVTLATDRVAYVPQNPASLLHLPTLRAEVELTARRLGVPESPAALLEPFGLAALADRYPRDLSSGERQRGALAATLAGRPRLALLDEPTRGMDLRARRSLGAVIRRMRDDGVCVVLATHDVDLAAEVADRAVALEDGRLVELGVPEVAFGAASNWATQIGRLLPGGPVTVDAALALLASPVADGAAAATVVAPADTRR